MVFVSLALHAKQHRGRETLPKCIRKGDLSRESDLLRMIKQKQAATEQTIRNLERENALIASAWYDLTSRLQSNHVVLQRRNEAPKSWLNKQRHLVNG